ncbi:hypothetical protein [Plantibacter sp. YIM 135249]|uniref:hypothetical protein n=1 Tax=Plantibacter sp. YIM 135249 TaxID=3423918 RepID=UPI003D33AA2B
MHDRLDAWILEGARPVHRRRSRGIQASGRSGAILRSLRANIGSAVATVHASLMAIREPRRLKAIYWAYYVAAAGLGAVTLSAPPPTVEGALGPVFTTAMSVLLILGGVVGASTVLGGWWRVERLGIWCALGATGIYAGVVTALDPGVLGTAPDLSRTAHLGFVLIASGLFVVRLSLIRGHDFEPHEARDAREAHESRAAHHRDQKGPE